MTTSYKRRYLIALSTTRERRSSHCEWSSFQECLKQTAHNQAIARISQPALDILKLNTKSRCGDRFQKHAAPARLALPNPPCSRGSLIKTRSISSGAPIAAPGIPCKGDLCDFQSARRLQYENRPIESQTELGKSMFPSQMKQCSLLRKQNQTGFQGHSSPYYLRRRCR